MRVLKHILATGKKIVCDYPAIWPNPIIGKLDGIEFYEIQYEPRPEYNPNEYECKEKTYLLTEQQGEVLKIALIKWQLTLIPKERVILNFNKSFGDFIDTTYPLWKRVKDIDEPTTESKERKTREKELRQEREERETNYIINNVFPSFEWEW